MTCNIKKKNMVKKDKIGEYWEKEIEWGRTLVKPKMIILGVQN